ncbi:hypothetical protein GCM10010994_53170 [Chelatococcus reniformis]|uniref:Uncharacterized protein n=1 Tax=Chelatococcus reniformis TaxID=1494448 RepID=A0A916UUR8_9HYPH|nr:hypothetical protein GCM10010994_53170 [Chelatococcus reniformis]
MRGMTSLRPGLVAVGLLREDRASPRVGMEIEPLTAFQTLALPATVIRTQLADFRLPRRGELLLDLLSRHPIGAGNVSPSRACRSEEKRNRRRVPSHHGFTSLPDFWN